MKKTCIFILGMHRSGTSALAGLFSEAGLDMGSDLIPAYYDNPKGYFEDWGSVQINERIFRKLDITWDHYRQLPADWWQSPKFEQELVDIKQNLSQNFSKDVFVIKDPRFSLTIPLWQQGAKELGITAKYIVMLRNPLEIASSLQRRNYFSQESSLLIWFNYLMNAEIHTRNLHRNILTFDNLTENPYKAICKVLDALKIEYSFTKSKTQINKFVTASGKHHNIKIFKGPNIPPHFTKFYSLLRDKMTVGKFTKTDYASLNKLYLQQNELIKFFSPEVIAHKHCKLMFDVGNDFNEGDSAIHEIKKGVNEITFNLKNKEPLKQIKFLASDQPVALKIIELSAKGTAGRKSSVKFSDYSSNMDMLLGDILVFDKSNPEITTELIKKQIVSEVILKVEYIGFGNDVHNLLMRHYKTISDNYAIPKTISSQLYIDTGTGFSEEISFVKNVNKDTSAVQFDLTTINHEISRLRFDPSQTLSIVDLTEIEIFDKKGNSIKFEYKFNGIKLNNDDTIFFTETDPAIIIDLKKKLHLKSITIKIKYHALGEEFKKYLIENLKSTQLASIDSTKKSKVEIDTLSTTFSQEKTQLQKLILREKDFAKQLQKNVDTISQKNAAISKTLIEKESKIENLEKDISKLNIKNKDFQNLLKNQENDISKLNIENKNINEFIKNREDDITLLSKKTEKLQDKINETTTEKERITKELESFIKNLTAEKESLQNSLMQLENVKSSLLNELELSQKDAAELKSENLDLSAGILQVIGEVGNLGLRANKSSGQKTRPQNEILSLKSDISELIDHFTKLKSVNDNINESNQELKKQIASLSIDISNLQIENEQLRNEKAILIKNFNDLKSENNDTNATNKELSKQIARLSLDLSSLQIEKKEFRNKKEELTRTLDELNVLQDNTEDQRVILEKQISAIKSSITWKVGQFCTFPARKVYDIFSNQSETEE